MKNNYVVIMAGGVGTRFWPMSRTEHPKQFIDILGTGKTLIQQTYERFLPVCPKENIYIVTNEIYKEMVMDQLPEIKSHQVITEPNRRNTAPCICYAAFRIKKENPDANMIVAPSDHLILEKEKFNDILEKALNVTATNDILVTIGIKPTRPDTGYGYIQFNDKQLEDDEEIKKVKTFTEKPDLEMAKFFLKSGDFLWNSGIFIWSVKSILKSFEEHLLEVYNLFKEGEDVYCTDNEDSFIKKTYTVCKNISIDYGIMEKAKNVYVVKAVDIGWSDLGTWGSLYGYSEKDENDNKIIGKNVITYDTERCIVNMPKDKLVVLQGLKNYIVAESDGILLVCKMSEEQQIRQIVNDVKATKGDKFV